MMQPRLTLITCYVTDRSQNIRFFINFVSKYESCVAAGSWVDLWWILIQNWQNLLFQFIWNSRLKMIIFAIRNEIINKHSKQNDGIGNAVNELFFAANDNLFYIDWSCVKIYKNVTNLSEYIIERKHPTEISKRTSRFHQELSTVKYGISNIIFLAWLKTI